jgi:hypothetical protein
MSDLRKTTRFYLWCDQGYLGDFHDLDEMEEHIRSMRRKRMEIYNYEMWIEVVITLRKEYKIHAESTV